MTQDERDFRASDGAAAELVVGHVRGQIERAELKPGDRLPPERELAVQIGVSRPSVRAGLRSLAAMGIVQTRHGAGTFITDGPPKLGSGPLSFLAALHGFTRDEMFEARRALEVGVAGLAAERATDEQIATIAEEVTGMFASLDDRADLPIGTTSGFTGRWRPHRATPSWPRWSRWSRPSFTSSGARRPATGAT